MKNSKKAFIWFMRILSFLFVLFLINYFAVYSGNYSGSLERKTVLTQEKIEEFEEDVKNNKYVDIKDYIEEYPDETPSFASRLGYKFSEITNDIVTDKIIALFQFLGKLFT